MCHEKFIEKNGFSIPLELRNEQLEYSECSMYKLNYTELVGSYPSLEGLQDSQPETVPCTHGWVYDMSTYTNTVVSEVILFEVSFRPLDCLYHYNFL